MASTTGARQPSDSRFRFRFTESERLNKALPLLMVAARLPLLAVAHNGRPDAVSTEVVHPGSLFAGEADTPRWALALGVRGPAAALLLLHDCILFAL